MSAMGLDKKALIEQLAAHIRESALLAAKEGEAAREAAKSMQTEAEKKEDGRAFLEMGSLATGQERRAREAQEALRALATFSNRGLPRLGPKSAVEVGAIIDVAVENDRGSEERTYFLLPVGAGTELTGPGGDGFLSVITPASPVGKALIGKRAGEVVDVTIARETREWTLVEVS
jgi:transcription elongation GreA/GreB family factor